jgi:hypothetical protein
MYIPINNSVGGGKDISSFSIKKNIGQFLVNFRERLATPDPNL